MWYAREQGLGLKRLPLGVNAWRVVRRELACGSEPWGYPVAAVVY